MIAFSIEKLSEGNPNILQALILTGSPSTDRRENSLSPEGIYFSLHKVFQSLIKSCQNF